ncbi:MAG: SufS family cysteine desulfurase [Panacagrimonas sp.]
MNHLDLDAIRADFPILAEPIHGKRLAYLDNAATTQKPAAVLDALDHYYRHDNSNVHRAVHELAARATTRYEAARDRIGRWFGCSREEVIFTRGTTEAINLVARSFLAPRLRDGDQVLLTGMEHHSNIVPWQLAGARTVAAEVKDDGSLDLEDWRGKLNDKTRLVSVAHVSNSLGTVNPIQTMIAEAHARNIPVLIDGAQATAHTPVNLHHLGADFYAASAHKAYGPTGFGCLLARREHLETMLPWQGGGDMIETVSFAQSTWNELPYKFEAGTPDISGAIGFAAALDWIEGIGLDAIHKHEQALLAYATPRMQAIDGLRLVGTAAQKAGVLSFVMQQAHPQDIGSILDMEGVAIRTGHHCTMPLMQRFGLPATARASLAVYNGTDDIDQLIAGLQKVVKLFA